MACSSCGWSAAEAPDTGIQGGKIAVDGGLRDCVRRVEVPVRQTVPHAGNVFPRNGMFGRQHVRTYPLDSLADLNEAEANGVEHEAVIE
jgi:hypothetical protein